MSKNQYIDKVLKDIDLTPTMEKNARNRYEAISRYISDSGIKCNFIPQGSFQQGTVVRPYKDGYDKNYDLDVVNLFLNESKNSITPKNVKNTIGDLLKSHKTYNEKLKIEDSICWTLKYTEDYNGSGLNLDLIPAIGDVKNHPSLGLYSENNMLITLKTDNKYNWKYSNSIDFGNWFLDLSKNHLTSEMKYKQKRNLEQFFVEYYSDSEVEELPEFYYRSSLQRAVQYVKRHRDIFYDRTGKRHLKPSSMIITSLITDSVKDEKSLSVTEILDIFVKRFSGKTISIIKNNEIKNPIDESENIAEHFTINHWKEMDLWINDLKNIITANSDGEIKRVLKNAISIPTFDADLIKNTNQVESTQPWKI